MQTRSSDENSDRPSVRPSVRLSVCLSVKLVDCDKTKEKSIQIFIPYYPYKNYWWETFTSIPEILGQTGRVGAKSQIFYLFSPVAPQP